MPRLGGVGKCLCAPGEAKSVLAETGACDTELGRWALKGVSMGLGVLHGEYTEQNVSWIRSRENVARICFFLTIN